MTERYSFFQDEAEKSQAIIGESAIIADLNGTFEKPYAVLTQQRLYCKNEQGNFIVNADQIQTANRAAAPIMPVLGWVVFAIAALSVALLALLSSDILISFNVFNDKRKILFLFFGASTMLCLSLVWVRKRPEVTLIFLIASSILLSFSRVSSTVIDIIMNNGINYLNAHNLYLYGQVSRMLPLIGEINFVLGIVSLILYVKKKRSIVYEIKHSSGTFFFQEKDYTQEELSAFSKAVAAQKETSI